MTASKKHRLIVEERDSAIYNNTKEEIYAYVAEKTKVLELKSLHMMTASQISLGLNISRNLASQYLNELVKSGELVKITSRPVYFLHKVTLERLYSVQLHDNLFQSTEELKQELSRGHILGKGFEKVIGRDESLHFCIEQIVSALGYPPSGLPILIVGERGCGKRYLSRIAYEYGLEQNILKESGRFIEVNCPEYAGNEPYFTELLFGSDSKDGILLHAKGGLIYFNEISAFSEGFVSRLLKLEEKREYYDCRNKVKRKFGGRMIFSASVPIEKMNGRNLQRIPVIISLPPLEERSAYEKEQLIISFLRSEAKRMGKEIVFNSHIISLLMEHPYSGNIEELQQVIRGSCARAYMDASAGKNNITLLLHHLPPMLVTGTYQKWSSKNGAGLIKLSSMESHGGPEQLQKLFEELLDKMKDFTNHKVNGGKLIHDSLRIWEEYKNTGSGNPQFFNGKVKVQMQVIEKLCYTAENPYKVTISGEGLGFLGKLLSEQNYIGSKLIDWMHQNLGGLEKVKDEYERQMQYEAAAFSWLEEQMSKGFQIQLNPLIRLALLLEFYLNNHFHFQKQICIMAAHGEDAARSMADYVNGVCRQTVIFPLRLGTAGETHIVRQIEAVVYSMKPDQELLFLLDLDLDPELETEITCLTYKGPFGISDQIGLKQLIMVGTELVKGSRVEEILQKLGQEEKRKSLFLESKRRLPTILFTSEMGIKTAEKFSEMFARCLPDSCEIQLLTYDYLRLMEPEQARTVFTNYDIICVVGMMPFKIERVPFISIENMISMGDSYRIKEILEPYLTPEQIETLIQGIVRDFTLQNVTRYLTILNPDKTLEYVHNALKEYQVQAGVYLSPGAVIGLSIHMCCMIERLVTKIPFEDHLDYQSFVDTEQVFIERMRKSMSVLCDFYHVEIPLGELAYIHDYIKNDRDLEDPYA